MMENDALLRAVLAGVGISFATGPLGAFVVWRRMAYFGDTIAHASILGVALALAFSMSIVIGTFTVALAVGLVTSGLATQGRTMDSMLGVLSHSALALGLVAMSFLGDVELDLEGFLFGDIQQLTNAHLLLIWLSSLAILALLIWRWSPLLMSTLNDELAASVGINPARERLVLTLALALVVALSLKIVGALLIGALLIIPAAAARGFARTPEKMAAIAILIGGVATLGGIGATAWFGTPAGPGIVVVAAIIFAASILVTWSQK